MFSLRSFPAVPILAFLVWGLISVGAPLAQEPPRYAGPAEQGFLLPNGWTLKPAGRHVPLADLPLNIIALAGQPPRTRGHVGIQRSRTCPRRPPGRKGCRSPSSLAKLVRPGGEHPGRPNLVVRRWRQYRCTRFVSTVGALWRATGGAEPARKAARKDEPQPFSRGLALDRAGKVLYSLDINAGTITALDLADRRSSKPHRPATGPTTSPSGAAALSSLSPTGPAAWCWRSTPATSAPSPGSPSASIPTRSRFPRRTIGCSSPAPRATASRSSTRSAAS